MNVSYGPEHVDALYDFLVVKNPDVFKYDWAFLAYYVLGWTINKANRAKVNRRFRAVMEHVREKAKLNGFIIPPAVPANRWVYGATKDKGSLAMDSMLHTGSQAEGTYGRYEETLEFVQNHADDLPEPDKVIVDNLSLRQRHRKELVDLLQRQDKEAITTAIENRRDRRAATV